MAGWIKMRDSLMQAPRLIALARRLRESEGFWAWFGASPSALRSVTDDALRCVALALLLRVWSAAREHGHFRGDDLLLARLIPSDLDQIAGVRDFGNALVWVGWAIESEDGIVLPNFKQHNVPRTGAERQKEYRKRAASKSGDGKAKGQKKRVTNRDAQCVTPGDAKVTRNREEKSIISPLPPEGDNGSEQTGKATRKRTARDDLFDAVAEVSGSDPTTTAPHISKVVSALLRANPPYAPEEVRRLPTVIASLGWNITITLGTIEKHIGRVRFSPGTTKQPAAPRPLEPDNRIIVPLSSIADAMKPKPGVET